jgi:hypothetical protein
MKILFKFLDPADVVEDAIETAELLEEYLLFRYKSGELPVHTAIQFSDGRCFQVTKAGGANWFDPDKAPGRWTAFDVPSEWLPFGEAPAVAWCEAIVGAVYDTEGVMSAGCDCDIRHAERLFCSLHSIECLSRCGKFGIPPMLTPGKLYLYCYPEGTLR